MKFALLGLGALILSVPPSRDFSAGPDSPCKVAAAWVAAHPGKIPSKLAWFRLFPLVYQKAAYERMTVAERTDLWSDHLTLYTGPASKLNAQQRDMVAAALQRLPALMADIPAAAAVFDEAAKLMGKRTAIVVFGKLGVVDPALLDTQRLTAEPIPADALRLATNLTASVAPKLVTLVASNRGRTLTAQVEAPNQSMTACACSTASDWCDAFPTGNHEVCDPSNCSPSGSGCGTFWQYSCDGFCHYQP